MYIINRTLLELYNGNEYSGNEYNGDYYSGDYYSGDYYSGDDYLNIVKPFNNTEYTGKKINYMLLCFICCIFCCIFCKYIK